MAPLLVFIGLLLSFFILEYALTALNGTSVPVPIIPREPVTYGTGKDLNYVVMGDSVSVGQGGDYEYGIAVQSARHLGFAHKTTLTNVGVSGARSKDVLEKQLPQVLQLKPDVVLIIAGSNDITHLTTKGSIKKSITQTVEQLIAANCKVKIVLTGAADMGAPPRIAQPMRAVAGQRTKAVNPVFKDIVSEYKLTFAPVAEQTGPIFRRDHSLFAPDNFHPNNAGYDVWTSVIIPALDDAMANQPDHCSA